MWGRVGMTTPSYKDEGYDEGYERLVPYRNATARRQNFQMAPMMVNTFAGHMEHANMVVLNTPYIVVRDAYLPEG